ncbi:MAG TPA: DUF1266 domain-containing protein, partial [Polyangiaceae bacterium]|nr:DUF1266 domain-containing protein [Polyangiaceae bacterium]
MRTSTELQVLLNDDWRQSLRGKALPDLLEGLDRLLKLGAPKVHESLRPGAAPSATRALADLAGCEGPPPEDLLTWFAWRDGQRAEPHRALTPKNDYHALLSVEQSRELIARSRANGQYVPGWVPLAARRDREEEHGLGVLTQGPHAGQLCKHDRLDAPSYPDVASFVRAITLKFQDVVSLPEPGQYWVHGVGALLLEDNRYHHALPGGLWPIASANCPVTIFREDWGVRSPEQLLSTLARLEARHTGSPLASNELAFKLGVASSLAALGRVAGWLSAEEAWTMQLRFANTIQRAFSSWREFGEAYIQGFGNGNGEDAYLQRLLADPTSPFHLPWHTPLDPKPTPDPPVDCFELTPDDHERLNDLLGHFRSPRLVDIKLEAGFYVLEQKVRQPVRLRGESTGDTVIQGMRSGEEALWVAFGGFDLQDLTIEHDVGEVPRKEDVADAVTLQGAVVFARRCKFVGSRNGFTISESSWGRLLDCEFVGRGHTGLSVGGAAVVSGGTTHGQVFGLFVWEGAQCWASGLRATGGKVGFRLEKSTAYLLDVETEGEKGDGLVITGSS